MAEHHETGEPFDETSGETTSAAGQVEKLRTMVNQASRSIKDQASRIKDLTQAGGHWAQEAQGRAREVAKELREQGNRTVGTVSQKVEHNPLTSLAVAFAVGFVVARLSKR